MRWLVAAMALMFAAPALAQAPAPAPAPATPAGPAYVVTYIEVAAASAAKAAGILRRFVVQDRQADGNERALVLREHGRPGRFAMVESWRDKAGLDAHAAATKALVDQLQPLLVAPPDPRFCSLVDGAPASGSAERPVFVLTHVDVIPSGKDAAVAAVKQLAADGRSDDGNLFFSALQQDNRANHMTLFEAWRDIAAYRAYVAANHTKEFRGKIAPSAGALYDERLYELVREAK